MNDLLVSAPDPGILSPEKEGAKSPDEFVVFNGAEISSRNGSPDRLL